MTRPLLSVIIPTIGRQTLEDTIKSIRFNSYEVYGDNDIEILVIGDSHKGTFDLTLAQVISDRYVVTYLTHDGGTHCYGHPQRNYGIKIANGKFLAWIQDDDIWLPGAIDAICKSLVNNRGEIDDWRPRLFRTHTWQAGVVWKDQTLREGNIDADCIVAANIPGKFGEWTYRYCGDFDFILDTCKLWDMNVRWEEFVIAQGRPSGRVNYA